MGGLVLDIWIAFVIRSFLNFSRKEDSRSWPVVTAKVISCLLEPQIIGCRCVELRYTYEIDGETFEGMFKEPFLSKDSANDYARRFPEDSETPVRVNPANHKKSFPVRG